MTPIDIYNRHPKPINGRLPIPVSRFWDELDPDTPAYLYLPEHKECGLDPWLILQGIDKYTDKDAYILEWGRASEMDAAPNTIIFIPVKYCPDCKPI